MSKKCLTTITLYTLFLAFMLGITYIFYYAQFTHLIGKIFTIIGLMIIAVALALTVVRGSFITIVFNAIMWGAALSFMFDSLGSPDPLHMVYAALVTVAWFALFGFLTNLSFIKKNYATAMLFWGVLLAIADVVFAVYMKNVLGWMSLILLVPFITFFVALPGEADGVIEHTHHIALYTTIPALGIAMLLMFFRVPIRSYRTGNFFPEVDEDFVFTYCPKYDDEDDEDADLSEFM